MSIFAMNYLNDISQYDQSLVDFNQKQLIQLKRKSQKARSINRTVKHQTFVKQKAQCAKDHITDEETKIIQDAISHQVNEKDDFSFEFIKVYESKFNKKSKMEDINLNENGQKQMKFTDFINQEENDPNMDSKQQIYLRIVQRRDEKIKKIPKRDYLFQYSGV